MEKDVLCNLTNSKRNLIVEGNPSSGKTTNIIFPIVEELISRNENLFILDNKEEYINRFYKKLKENNYNIVIINLRNMEKSEGWNPLWYPYQLYKNGNLNQTIDYLQQLGSILYPYNTNVVDAFTSITLGLFEDAKGEEINLNSIYSITQNGLEFINKSSKRHIEEYFDIKKSTKSNVIPISEHLLSYMGRFIEDIVLDEHLSNILNKTTFELPSVLNKKTAVIFIGKEEVDYFNKISVMFIEQLFKIVSNNNFTNKFNIILSTANIEFTKLSFDGRINTIIDMLTLSHQKSIKFILSTYSKERLYLKYGSYIGKLCDSISILDETLKIITSNSYKIIDKDFDFIFIEDSIIDYPHISKNSIYTFDLKKYVMEHLTCNTLETNLNESSGTYIDVDALIKRIDDHIACLESEENK